MLNKLGEVLKIKTVNGIYTEDFCTKITFLQKIKSRTKRGDCCNRLKSAYFDYLQNKNNICKKVLLKHITEYFFGSFIASSLFKTDEVLLLYEYNSEKALYHFTDIKNIENIKKHGITTDKEYVFLTDDVEFFIKSGYLEWKTFREKRDIEFCILPIDVKNLSKTHDIYKINRSHEFVVEKIEPKYVLFE